MKRQFNVILIGALVAFIIYVTAGIFLGSQETFDKQLEDLPIYFLKRTAGGVIIGFPGCAIIAIGNLLLTKRETERRVRILRMVLWALLLSFMASIIGTGIFYFH